MEWQDIESAPRDGTWIIAWDGENVLPLCWVDDSYEHGGYTGWAHGTSDWGGTLYDGYNEVSRQPIAFMPLPPPPAKE
jgi:hypothetical protein